MWMVVKVAGLLEVVQGDAEGFATAEIVEERSVCLLGFGLVVLRKIDKV